MKKIFFVLITVAFLTISSVVSAQGMMGFANSSPDNTAIQSQQQEEQEGKNLLDNLNNKTIICSQLKDTDFEKIGEYFMGQSIRDTSRHIVMNEMMKSMMGEQGEEQMHIAWGKRGSGCDTSAAFPSQETGFIPMMNMMWRGWSSPAELNQNNNNSMMWGFGFGWIFMLIFWILIIAGIVVLIKWLVSQSHGTYERGKTPLDILKERYAKGEINKEEFEAKKKNLGL